MNHFQLEGLSLDPFTTAGSQKAYTKLLLGEEGQTPSLRIIKLEPGGRTGSHTHKRAHLTIALRGKVSVKEEGGSLTLNPLEGLFIEPYRPHSFANPWGEPALLLVFNVEG